MGSEIIDAKAEDVTVEPIKTEEDKKTEEAGDILSLMTEISDLLGRLNPNYPTAITAFGNIIRRSLFQYDEDLKKEVADFLSKSCMSPMTEKEKQMFAVHNNA